MKTEVYCTLQIEGLHHWPECPFEEVAYLRDLHRHVFHIKAYKLVTHSDRDIEFIMLKHKITSWLEVQYYSGAAKCCLFGPMSCEMIAEELITEFELSKCEVSEDGENGAIVTVDTYDPSTISPLSQYPSYFDPVLHDAWLKAISTPQQPEAQKIEVTFNE